MRAARALAAAVAFLTRVPVARRLDLGADDVARGAPLFPLVGGAVGGLTGLVALGLGETTAPLVAAGVALAVAAALTGALHLDALADTADALGGWSRARALQIMRDHSIGAFGASALVLDLLAKAAAIASLLPGRDAALGLVAAGACSRAVALPLAAALPYARAGGGSGSALTDGATWPRAAVGAALAAGVAVAALGWHGAVVVGAAAVVAVVLGLGYRRWLGGVTGDTLGAATELAETVGLVVVAALR